MLNTSEASSARADESKWHRANNPDLTRTSSNSGVRVTATPVTLYCTPGCRGSPSHLDPLFLDSKDGSKHSLVNWKDSFCREWFAGSKWTRHNPARKWSTWSRKWSHRIQNRVTISTFSLSPFTAQLGSLSQAPFNVNWGKHGGWRCWVVKRNA